MLRPSVVLALLLVAARAPGVRADSGSLPTWLAYVTGGLLVIIIVYYCCRRARFDENLQQPLLGGYVVLFRSSHAKASLLVEEDGSC